MAHQRGVAGPTGYEGAATEAAGPTPSSTATEPESNADDPSLGVHRRARHRWWHSHLDSDERKRVMSELAIKPQEHWAFRFTVMITLSVIVAVMGMSANSAAVVIGAMLLAPLMQPVLATAAFIAMALFQKSLRSFVVVALATLWAIVLSNVISVPDFAVTLGAMIGIGVGIDDALFIVTRYREGLKAGLDRSPSTPPAGPSCLPRPCPTVSAGRPDCGYGRIRRRASTRGRRRGRDRSTPDAAGDRPAGRRRHLHRQRPLR